MKNFELKLSNPNNAEENAQVIVRVYDDRRWDISIFGKVALPDNTLSFFTYSTKGKDWENNNPRLEAYIKHRIKVAVGKDILNLPDCPVKSKPKFWKEANWLVDFNLETVVKAWKD